MLLPLALPLTQMSASILASCIDRYLQTVIHSNLNPQHLHIAI